MKPLISVIIPVYNCATTIETAIRSILDQTYPNLEIIVVNDGSTDDTKVVVSEIMKKEKRVSLYECETDDSYRYDEKLKRNVNAGYAARNTGFKYAKGDYVTFQDADDASLLNRIEVQYELLIKYGAEHVTLDWIAYEDRFLGKQLDVKNYVGKRGLKATGPEELYVMARRARGVISKISPALNRSIPFHFKRLRIANKLFFGTLENFPGTGNSPLFSRRVLESIPFRRLSDRIWPSFMGRGADRDFNFQVAETFKKSYVFYLPLYLWRQPGQNKRYEDDVSSYIID